MANLKVAIWYFLIVIVVVNVTLACNTSASTSIRNTPTIEKADSGFIYHKVDAKADLRVVWKSRKNQI